MLILTPLEQAALSLIADCTPQAGDYRYLVPARSAFLRPAPPVEGAHDCGLLSQGSITANKARIEALLEAILPPGREYIHYLQLGQRSDDTVWTTYVYIMEAVLRLGYAIGRLELLPIDHHATDADYPPFGLPYLRVA